MEVKFAMKKVLNRTFVLVLVLGLIVLLAYRSPKPYSMDLEFSDIVSVDVYHTNEAQKKVVIQQKDIQKLLTNINSQKNYGFYSESELPVGGQSFVYVFHLENGMQKICSFFDTGARGYFNDGSGAIETTGFDGLFLWETLEYESQRSVVEHEVVGIPPL